MIPVSVLITTKNEAANIGRCLAALRDFSEIIVVDSHSHDDTQKIAAAAGARVVSYQWNGGYPKKRQWCLDTLSFAHDWVFFVDADEIIPQALTEELRQLFENKPSCAGYFVKGRYVIDGKALRYGLENNKLCLIDRRKIEFPVIDDLDVDGMGEIEGHYQPVLKTGQKASLGQIREALFHYAYEQNWMARHQRYAAWERAMNHKNAWPRDPVRWRQFLKCLFRAVPFRSLIAFFHCYIFKRGFLDGKVGFILARDRFRYYRMITS